MEERKKENERKKGKNIERNKKETKEGTKETWKIERCKGWKERRNVHRKVRK